MIAKTQYYSEVIPVEFKDKIKARRLELGMTLDDVAKLVGVSNPTISRWESGAIVNQRRDKIELLAKALQLTPGELMGWEDDTLPSNVLPFPSTRMLPRLGPIACGDPILAEENIEGYDPVPDFVHADYTLVCKGDSMTGARILDGDIVCIKQDAEVRSGDIAAVLVDGDEATLKRVHFRPDGVILLPENPAYSPMVFTGADAQRVRIIGKATHFISSVR